MSGPCSKNGHTLFKRLLVAAAVLAQLLLLSLQQKQPCNSSSHSSLHATSPIIFLFYQILLWVCFTQVACKTVLHW
jgi:hypothetical protein